MASVLVQKEHIFQVPAENFALSPSAEGYTLHYSADGVHFTAWDTPTPAGKNEVITDAPINLYYKLVGNNSDLILQY